MADKIQLHDVVALMEDAAATRFLTHQPLQLRRGQVGTVVMLLTAITSKSSSRIVTAAPTQFCRLTAAS
jgi:hypothetical protein